MKISLLLFQLIVFYSPISLPAAPIQVPNWGGPDLRDHPGYYPFIAFLTFQRYCADWIICNHTDLFDPDVVEKGDVILVDYFYLDWFVNHIHDEIKEPYILLTTDKGAWAPNPNIKRILYDPKVAAWFCRNLVFSGHPKLFQIPMGPDMGYFRIEADASFDLLRAVVKKPYPKKYMLYQNYYPRTHCDRDKIVKLFENEPYCFSVTRSDKTWEYTPTPLFYEQLASSKFALSPLGFETDCLRTWEALVLGTIPIVEHSFLDPLFEELPVLIIHDWTEINLPFLEEQYLLLKDLRHDKLYFDYWHDQIAEVKKRVQNSDWPFANWEATHLPLEDLKTFDQIIREKGKGVHLIYKGFLSTAHPFQIASFSPSISSLQLYDAWFDPETYQRVYFQTQDPLEIAQLVRASSKVSLLKSEDDFEHHLLEADALFLDFSYYRHSLYLKHFYQSIIGDDHFRHSLQRDLGRVYDRLRPGAILFGNRADDRYVSECLDRFSKARKIEISKRKNFWVIKKT